MVLFVFETEHAERAFLRIAANMPEAPLASATVESIGFTGPPVRRGGCRLQLHPNAVAPSEAGYGDRGHARPPL